uniref:UDP-glucuronic acid decarboxylase 1 n=1 Tax=Haemonchus contortus TaxID=6289 RepID=A0A7I4YR69_HAECO
MPQPNWLSRLFSVRLVILMFLVFFSTVFVISSVYNVALVSSNPFSIDPETGYSSAHVSKLYVMEKERSLALSARLEILEKELEHLKSTLRKSATIVKGPSKTFPDVRFRNEGHRKRILVTGGAGFVGSHLVDKLMMDGHEVIALDNYFTGRKRNVERWIGHPNFELVHHDVVNPYFIEVDQIYHLASPASPPHYMYNPVKTIKTNTLGTINMLGLANYWGHVNTIGPRSCYDEGKRVAESLMVAYNKQERVPIRIARIFNTFGPRMHMNDGRVVSNFIIQALQGNPITIYGDGSQTRSFQYVDDLVDGLILLMNSNCSLPVNLGNPEEYSISNFARIIKDLVGSESVIVNKDSQEDDPQQRKPDISRAAKELNWQPQVSMRDGLIKTIEYFREEINEHHRLSSDDDGK